MLVYWYRARLYINRRFCEHVFLKSDSADYNAGDKIEKHYMNGFLITLIVSHFYGNEKPAFPVIISEV